MQKTAKKTYTAKNTAFSAMLCAAAILCSYVETLIPLQLIPIPGFKIGLANVVIMLALYRLSLKDALVINIARSIIIAMLFSGFMSILFSLIGGTLALLSMALLKKANCFSVYGVGVGGAIMHNTGQLITAAVLLKTTSVFAYFPWLMLCSILSGILIAFICGLIYNAFLKITAKTQM